MMMSTNNFFIFSNNLLDRQTLDLYNRYGTYISVYYVKSKKLDQSLPKDQYVLIPNFFLPQMLLNSINIFDTTTDPFLTIIHYKILRKKQFLFLLKL